MDAEVVSRSMRAGSLTENNVALLPSRAPTERCVVLDTITRRGRRSGDTQPSGLPLALQPLREQSPDEFVEAHPLEVGASTEPTKQRGVEADLDHGRGHLLIVTAEPDRSALARSWCFRRPALSIPLRRSNASIATSAMPTAMSGIRDPGADDVMARRRRTRASREQARMWPYPVWGNFARMRKFRPARASFSSEVREWRWSAWRRRHTAPGPSLQKLALADARRLLQVGPTKTPLPSRCMTILRHSPLLASRCSQVRSDE
jgi:hypothetical protein